MLICMSHAHMYVACSYVCRLLICMSPAHMCVACSYVCRMNACMQVRSLIFMFANNIAQIACLLAEREGIDNIIFSGGFIRDNAYVWSKIAFGLDFWSGSRLQVIITVPI